MPWYPISLETLHTIRLSIDLWRNWKVFWNKWWMISVHWERKKCVLVNVEVVLNSWVNNPISPWSGIRVGRVAKTGSLTVSSIIVTSSSSSFASDISGSTSGIRLLNNDTTSGSNRVSMAGIRYTGLSNNSRCRLPSSVRTCEDVVVVVVVGCNDSELSLEKAELPKMSSNNVRLSDRSATLRTCAVGTLSVSHVSPSITTLQSWVIPTRLYPVLFPIEFQITFWRPNGTENVAKGIHEGTRKIVTFWLTVGRWNTAKESSLGCAITPQISNDVVVVCHRTFGS